MTSTAPRPPAGGPARRFRRWNGGAGRPTVFQSVAPMSVNESGYTLTEPMHTGTLSIKNLFEQERRHLVPLYQRPYVWTEDEQWKPLWEDVRSVADRLLAGEPSPKPHFLGAIVLEQVRKPTGHVETRILIDGQQRLTTIQLLLEAFADLCGTFGVVDYQGSLLKLTRNADPLSKDADEQFKVWPTNANQPAFRRVMLAGSAEAIRGDRALTGKPLAKAYLFFATSIAEWLRSSEDGFAARVDALLKTVREHIRIVVIDLGEEDDPQLIFETLNARGTPLLPADLVKNLLYYRASVAHENADELYARYWRPFDEDHQYWRKELGRGHAKRARLDTFLQHYLALQTNTEMSVAHLYTAFRDFIRQLGAPPVKDQLESIYEYAQIYRGFDQTETNTREGQFFERLRILEATTIYPFLLKLFRGAYSDSVRRRVLQDVESFLVRRLVCQLSTRSYNRFFLDLLGVTSVDEGDFADQVRHFLLASTAEGGRWPADAEFRDSWLEHPVYTRLRHDRVRMLLEALEKHAHTGRTERLAFNEKLTIEHLLPQEWQRHWPLPTPSAEIEAHRNRVLHTFGNLTLLTKALNPSVSNGPWQEKKAAILEYSSLNLNRRLAHADIWNEEAIRRRGQETVELAIEIWPRPSGSATS